MGHWFGHLNSCVFFLKLVFGPLGLRPPHVESRDVFPRSQLWSAGGRLKAVYAVLVLVSSAPFVHRTECHVSVMGLDKAG